MKVFGTERRIPLIVLVWVLTGGLKSARRRMGSSTGIITMLVFAHKSVRAARCVFAIVASALLVGCAHQSSVAPAARSSLHNGERPQDPREARILADVVQLTHSFDRAGEAYFSPDMKWIIFQASPHGQTRYQMFLAPLNWQGDRVIGAGEPIQISPPGSRNTCGFFSNDGHSILFASTDGREDPKQPEQGYQGAGQRYRWDFSPGMEIYRCDDWRRKVQSAGGKPIDLAQIRLTNNNVYDAEGSFSPDGKWVLFTSLRTTDGDIYVMKRDGSHVVQLTNAPGYDGGPFFSPDGRRIVFRSDRQKNDLLQIFTGDLAFDVAGNITGLAAEHQLTHDKNVNWGPYWYPDGRHIIYATSKHGHQNYELYAMRDDGSHTVRITYSPGADILPVFSPDGKWLMWTSKRSANNTSQIFIARFTPPADW